VLVVPKPRLLLVDDEEAILRTLGAVLQINGFEVQTAANVSSALQLIHSSQFDVLLTDLNIGQPADGFTLVSAMRHTQPRALTIIITGYPDFETALESLRNQVDDYILKPADPQALVQKIHFKLTNRMPVRHPLPTKEVAQIISGAKLTIIQEWLAVVRADPEISRLRLPDSERTDHLPDLLDDMAHMLQSREGMTSSARVQAAKLHGRIRRQQGYSIPMVLEETRILQQKIFTAIQADLLSVNFSLLIPDIMRTSDTLEVQLRASIEAFLAEPELTDAA
jgi:YesN/AraC family two-component response regulator